MTNYRWVVVGAGPAGIATVGSLLDRGITGSEILWVDPRFDVGDFGSRWKNIPSNTKVHLFLKFLHACDAFSYASCDQDFTLNHLSGEHTCLLREMVEPLQWVTHQLQAKVQIKQDWVESVAFKNHSWFLKLNHEHICAENVVLAIGAEPKTLAIHACPMISLQDAMDHESLREYVDSEDVVAVFGSSHSAVLALKNLVNHSVKKVINFYRSPLLYAIYTGESILHDDTGLKGTTAEWAREHLHEVLPRNLVRVESNDSTIQAYLPECTKVVYAVGFERRHIPIDGIGNIQYNNKTGVIAPGLFGFGIAFPEGKTNALGGIEHSVGLWKFMSYLQRVMPVWLENSCLEARNGETHQINSSNP